MLIHHLFPFADRIPQSAEIIWLFGNNSLETHLGLWGKYCVAIFLFISGYGYALSKRRDKGYYLDKIIKIYRTTLLIFVIYIPLDIYFNVDRVVSALDIKHILFNILGFYSNYNGEWWFLFPYVLMVAVTPLMNALRNNALILFILSIIIHNLPASQYIIGAFLWWQTAYVIGFICGIYQQKLAIYQPNKIIYKLGLFMLSLIVLIWGYNTFNIEEMLFFTPLFIYILKLTSEIMPKFIKIVFVELGRKCQIIWLVHSFYCYHFAGNFIYSPKYSVLILLNLLVVSYVSAVVLGFIEKNLVSGYHKIINKRLSLH
ncbi:acyltransferase family protein [Rodentibacter rarus]|uniref:acyltransferase family protein n=2 Tax=Rodentibacter rarus TaxID=1908260 RepID=UPI000984A317